MGLLPVGVDRDELDWSADGLHHQRVLVACEIECAEFELAEHICVAAGAVLGLHRDGCRGLQIALRWAQLIKELSE